MDNLLSFLAGLLVAAVPLLLLHRSTTRYYHRCQEDAALQAEADRKQAHLEGYLEAKTQYDQLRTLQ